MRACWISNWGKLISYFLPWWWRLPNFVFEKWSFQILCLIYAYKVEETVRRSIQAWAVICSYCNHSYAVQYCFHCLEILMYLLFLLVCHKLDRVLVSLQF